MKKLYFISLLIFCSIYSFAQEQNIPVPKPHQLKWHEAEMGAVFHYDLHVFDGIRYGQGNNRINPIEDYNIFNPTELNTDQWVQAAKAAGCKFAVITATHETGFGLWQSDVNPYCLKAVKWRDGKGDIVRDFVNSCHKYGLQPGIYVGIRWNSLLGIHNFKAEGFRGLDRDFLTIFPREDHFDRVDRHLRIILRRNIISPGEIPVFCLYVLQGKDWGDGETIGHFLDVID